MVDAVGSPTAVSGAAAGLLGIALGPVGAAVLLALVTGAVTATVAWAAPTIRLFATFRND